MKDFYLTNGIMSDPAEKKYMISEIPKDISKIVELTQNILLHQHCAGFYGVTLDKNRIKETWLRKFSEQLTLLEKRGYKDIHQTIPLNNKIIGICRDFALISAALCREAGIPARARCGFATYFEKGKFIDHWVLEYWNSTKMSWILVDSQFDDILIKKFNITFDTKNVANNYFINGANAWKMCRAGEADAEKFGIFEFWGYDYIKCNLLLDANSLLKMTLQPWDIWPGLKTKSISKCTGKEWELLDTLADLVDNINSNFEALRSYVESHDEIKVPDDLSKIENILDKKSI